MAVTDTRTESSEFLAIATLLTDPKRLKDEYDKLEAAKAKANEAIALVGKASEIVALRAQAEKDLKAAEAKLEEATERADEIVAQAEREAEATRASAQRDAQAMLSDAGARKNAAIAAQQHADDMANEYKEKAAMLAQETQRVYGERDRVNDARREALEAKERYDEAHDRLVKVRDSILAVLSETGK